MAHLAHRFDRGKSMKEKIKHYAVKVYHYISGFFPHALPRGRNQFEAFCGNIFFAYDLPDFPSYRHSVATMIMHLDPTHHRKAPYFFAKSIKKAMANQVAYEMIQEIKEAEKAAAQVDKVVSIDSK